MTDSTEEKQIHGLIDQWAAATRNGQKDAVLDGHAGDARIFDVLPPLEYTSAADHRRSFDD